ncbi:unnamed protein product, partial [marine sediment metagenome]
PLSEGYVYVQKKDLIRLLQEYVRRKLIVEEDKDENNIEEINETINRKKEALEKNLIIVSEEDKITVHLKVKQDCPKCGHREAEAWQEQTRSADEPSTSFFRCVKCKYTWREY